MNENNEEILKQIRVAKKGNAILLGSNREIRRLPLELSSGEQVLKIITGSPGQWKGRGIVVATDERVLFIKDGWIFRTVQDFPYETISSVEFRTRFFFGTFIMYGKGDETAYNWVGRVVGPEFSKFVRQLSTESKRQPTALHQPSQAPQPAWEPSPAQQPTTPINTPEQTVMGQLKALEALRNEGLINIDEYEIKKQEIMSRL